MSPVEGNEGFERREPLLPAGGDPRAAAGSTEAPFVAVASSASQFDILDIVLFTTGFGLAFALFDGGYGATKSFGVLGVAYALVAGSVLGFFLLLCKRQYSGADLFRAPGCVLLASSGLGTLTALVFYQLRRIGFGDEMLVLDPSTWQTWWHVGAQVISGLVSIVVLAIGFRHTRLRWKVFLSICICQYVSGMLAQSAFLFTNGIQIYVNAMYVNALVKMIAVLACLVCVMMDFRLKPRYVLLHKIGLALFFLSFAALPLLQMVLARFLTMKQLYGG